MTQVDAWQVLDLLTSLVDKSLVVYEEDEGGGRYRLLESVRRYAAERLDERGEAEAVGRRHRDHFLALAEHAEPRLRGPEQRASLARLEAEHDNLRAALDWCLAEPAGAEAGLRLAAGLWRFWHVRGHWSEGRERLAALLARPGAQGPTQARADALSGAGLLALRQGDGTAARSLSEESLALRHALGDRRGAAASILSLGYAAQAHGDYASARSLLVESVALFRKLGDKSGVAVGLGKLGDVAKKQGEYAAARPLHEEGLALRRELGDKHGIADSLTDLGALLRSAGDYSGARTYPAESLLLCRQLGDRSLCAYSLEQCADLERRQGRPRRAARLWGAAQALREALGSPLPPFHREEMASLLAALAASLGPAAFAAALAEGGAMAWERAVEYALSEDTSGDEATAGEGGR